MALHGITRGKQSQEFHVIPARRYYLFCFNSCGQPRFSNNCHPLTGFISPQKKRMPKIHGMSAVINMTMWHDGLRLGPDGPSRHSQTRSAESDPV